MSVKLEVEFEDKASSVADKIADKLDKLSHRVEAVHDKQASAAEREAVRGAKAQEREANRAAKAAAKAAEKASAAVEREASQQAKAAEREASRAVKAAERGADAKVRSAERETRAVERARSRQLRALREGDRERTRREREEKRASQDLLRRRRQEHKSAEDSQKDGFWWNFKANLAANAVGKTLELAGAGLKAAHTLGRVREQQGFIFDTFARGESGNMGADYLAHADALAERFGLNLEETRIKYQRLLGLKQAPKQIDRLIRLGGDLEASGRSEEYVSEIYDAINQIAIKPKGSLNDIATEAISRLGVTNDDILAGLAKELGQKSATQEDLTKYFGKEGADSQGVQRLLLNAVENSLGISNAGDLAAKYIDETMAGAEDQALVKAQLIGEKFSKGLLEAVRPAFAQVADWIGGLDVDKAEGAGKTFAQFFGFGENSDAQKQWIADKDAKGLPDTGFWGGFDADASKLFGLVFDEGSGASDKAAEGAGKNSQVRFEQIGTNMAAGLVKGLDAQKDAVAEAGARLSEGAAEGAEMQVEIQSPSKRMMRDGGYMGAGLAIGIEDSAANVEAAYTDMISPLLGGIDAGPVAVPVTAEMSADASPQLNPTATFTGAANNGATIQVTAPISITIGGDGQTPGAVVNELRRSLRRDVENMFEEVALSLGTP